MVILRLEINVILRLTRTQLTTHYKTIRFIEAYFLPSLLIIHNKIYGIVNSFKSVYIGSLEKSVKIMLWASTV